MSPSPTPGGGPWPPSGSGRGRLPASERDGWPAARDDDGWGPSTAVYSAAAAAGNGGAAAHPRGRSAFYPSAPPRPKAEPWTPAGPRSAGEQRDVRAAERRAERAEPEPDAQPRERERGLPWWAALLLLIAIACVGGLIDTLGSIQVKGGFNVGIVIASLVAIVAVRRSHMFPVVIAPPIVYSTAALFQLYVRSSGLNDKRVIRDAALNYLVYGFPAIAAASAGVLIIAGIRLISRK